MIQRSLRTSQLARVGLLLLVTGLVFERLPFSFMGVTIFKLLTAGAALLAVCVVATRTRTPAVIPRNPLALAYFAWLLFTVVVHPDSDHVRAVLSQSLMLVIAALLLTLHRWSRGRGFECSIIAVSGTFGLAGVLLHVNPELAMQLGLRTAGVWLGGERLPRLVGASNDPNFAAWLLILPLLISARSLVLAETSAQRVAWSSLVIVFTGLILGTWSRGGMAALGVAGMVQAALAVKPVRSRIRRMVLLILVLGAITYSYGGDAYFTMLGERFASRPLEEEPRLELWNAAVRSVRESPIVGNGFPVLVRNEGGALQFVHNTWLEVLSGVGLPGFLFYAGAWIWALSGAMKLPISTRLWVVPAMTASMTAMTFLSAIGLNYAWFILYLPEIVNPRPRRHNSQALRSIADNELQD